jgi:hypothetical protein
MSKTRLTGRRALLTAVVLSLFAPLPAKAQGILDLGKMLLGIEDEKPEIEYRERAPLVVPPKTELPAPRERASASNPNWPKDPDVEARKAADAARRAPRPETQGPKSDRLSIEEMRAGRKAGAGLPGEPSAGPSQSVYPSSPNNPGAQWIHPDELRAISNRAAAVTAAQASGVEPDRRFLTDPPRGYRKPAPGAPVAAPRDTTPITTMEREDPFAVYRKP